MKKDLKQQESVPQESPVSPVQNDYLKHFRITADDIKRHMSGPIFSLAFHIIIILLLAFVFIMTPDTPEETVTVEMKEMEVIQPPELPVEEPPPPQETELTSTDDLPPGPAADVIGSTNINLAVTDVIASDVVNDVDIPSPLYIQFSNSALKLPGAMGARTKGGIANGLKNFGGSGGGENAVLRALRWLKKVQNADGSWGSHERSYPNTDPALTGLATLTFLAHGETPESKEFGVTVEKALRRLVEYANQLCDQANSSELKPGAGNEGNDAIAIAYMFPIVCYAVSEGYAMTKIPDLELVMNRMVRRIIQGQNASGGFEYNFSKNALGGNNKRNLIQNDISGAQYRCDLSVGGWVCQALKAAFSAGCKVDGLATALDKFKNTITTVNAGKDDRYTQSFTYENSYGKHTGSVAMTAIGVLSLNLMGFGSSAEAKKGLGFLEKYEWNKSKNPELIMSWADKDGDLAASKAGHAPLYTWYYYTQAIFQGNKGTGTPWKKWNASFNPALVKEQHREGYWETPRFKYGGDSNGTTYEDTGRLGSDLSRRVYATTLCTMMLEVYYRLLPTFQTVASTTTTSSAGKYAVDSEDDDDISL